MFAAFYIGFFKLFFLVPGGLFLNSLFLCAWFPSFRSQDELHDPHHGKGFHQQDFGQKGMIDVSNSRDLPKHHTDGALSSDRVYQVYQVRQVHSPSSHRLSCRLLG
jgi:hypothetical protein